MIVVTARSLRSKIAFHRFWLKHAAISCSVLIERAILTEYL
jgi:hypothetical protein